MVASGADLPASGVELRFGWRQFAAKCYAFAQPRFMRQPPAALPVVVVLAIVATVVLIGVGFGWVGQRSEQPPLSASSIEIAPGQPELFRGRRRP